MKNFVLYLLLIVGLASCQKHDNELSVSTDARLAASLRKSSQSLNISGNKLMLSTYLWRDFMPMIEGSGEGSRLLGVIRLADTVEAALPQQIRLVRLYVIKGNEVWQTGFSESSMSNSFTIEGVVRNGPFWGPNIEVDVVLEFEISGRMHRIMAKKQTIHRTD
ncbi:MAG: hypothetical protein IPM52_11435 [Bacteroidetes bacterium]|nr:hypothetical protein [Bacteroidota bacterium]